VTPIARLFVAISLAIIVTSPLSDVAAAHATTASGPGRSSQSVSLGSRERSTPTTAWTAANCVQDAGDFEQTSGGEIELRQALDGDLTGCFRVPSLRTSKLVVGLQAYANRTVPSSTQVVTNVSSSPSDGDFTLSASTYNVTPGETLTLFGHYAGRRPSQINGSPYLCWDGCQSGLREQETTLKWVSRSTFRIAFRVPDAAWFQESGKKEFIHPLTSGNYSVGIQCITVSSGCALFPADAQVMVHLAAPQSARCRTATHCAYLSFSSNAAQAGDVISVRGWAPLADIIGQPFGLSLTVAKAKRDQTYAPFTATADVPDEFNLVLARHPFTVRPDASWSVLAPLHPILSTWSGVSTVGPLRGSPRIAWCRSTYIAVTGGTSVERIATSDVPLALRDTNLKTVGPRDSHPPCASVTLDPHRLSTIYAGFYVAINGEAPPVNLVGMYTLDSGATWHAVPAPPGLNVDDFEGFTSDAQGIVAMFAQPYSDNDEFDARITIRSEVTNDGGLHWSPSTLGCPAVGPCVTFGTYLPGNCAMNQSAQPLLIGTPAAALDVKWTSTSWVTMVNTCFSQQLVATSPQDVLLLDPSSPYSLLRSTNGGTTWANIDLPAIAGSTLGSDNPSDFNSLLLAADGSIFASLTNTAGTKQDLYRLPPRATSWCVVPKAFGTFASEGVATALQSSGDDVTWMQSVYSNNGSDARTTLHVRPVASLNC